jgi:hypothetical protein
MMTVSCFAARGADSSAAVWMRVVGTIYFPWFVCGLALASGIDLVKGLLFTIHSPVGFLLLWLSFPWAVIAGCFLWRRAKRSGAPIQARTVSLALISYPALAWPFSLALHRVLNPPFRDTALDYYLLLLSPIGKICVQLWHAV